MREIRTLGLSYGPQALSEAAHELDAAAEAGYTQVILDLDGWTNLPDEAIRGLITLLREARRLNLEIVAEATVAAVREDFMRAGLDRLIPLRRREAAA